jgi:putative transposase
MKSAYKFRIYPKPSQAMALDQALYLCRKLYNAALEERVTAYKVAGLSIGVATQINELPELKTGLPEYKTVYAQVLQDIPRRLNKAFDGFFRRVRECRKGKKIKAGFPRFKGRNHFRSITYPQGGFRVLPNGHLEVSRVGIIRMFKHRDIEGTIKTCTLKKDAVGDWFAILTTELPDVPLKKPRTRQSVDLGLIDIVRFSAGDKIPAPKMLRKSEDDVKRLQRRLSKKNFGSKRREEARRKLAKAHRRIERQRDDFLHKLSKGLVDRADVTVFEGLNIQDMLKSHQFAKSILDASWGKLMNYTAYKAANAGKLVEFVDPRGTSQICSRCGETVQKPLSERLHLCPQCGFCLDRDWNAALNILKRGRLGTDGVELLKMPVENIPLPTPEGVGKHGQ